MRRTIPLGIVRRREEIDFEEKLGLLIGAKNYI
jgi:hypothetical protein